MRLGDLLMQAKMITAADVAKALEIQAEKGGRLGDLLVSIGAISQKTLHAFIHRMPREPQDLESIGIDAIADVGRFGVGRLVVARRDRLARDVVTAGLVERLVERAGGRVCSTDGMSEAEGPEGVLLRGIADLFAVFERLLIASRTRAALQAKKAKGERTGMIPFGFSVAADGKILIPNVEEQKVIATVRRLREKGLTLRAVVTACERRGIVSRSGKPLGLVQVDRLLRRAA